MNIFPKVQRSLALLLVVGGFLCIEYHYGVISPERGELGRHLHYLRSHPVITLEIAEQEVVAMHERYLQKYSDLGPATFAMLAGALLGIFARRPR